MSAHQARRSGPPEVAQRGADEEVDDAMAANIRNALALYKPLREVDGP